VILVQIAPEIAPGSGVGGVAHHLEREWRQAGHDVRRFTLADAHGSWLPAPGAGLPGKLALTARVVWFSTVGTVLARRYLARLPGAVSICHNDVLAGGVYVNHGILRAAMQARGNYAWRMARNPLHLFTSARDTLRYRGSTHDVVVNLTDGEEAALRATYPGVRPRTEVIGNGVDTTRFRPPSEVERRAARKTLGLAEDDVCCLFVGHEFDRKGLPLLIAALIDLPEVVHTVVAGGTPDMVAAARHLADERGIAARLHFLGQVTDPLPCYHAADVFALPSAYEANALVLLEALACGLPIIATPVGHAAGLVEEGRNGYLVERSVPAVRDALLRFTTADGAAMAAAARRTAEGNSWQEVARRYLELAAALAAARAPASVPALTPRRER
jgi:glycosyltransferase involved in cell wall biosynthesis